MKLFELFESVSDHEDHRKFKTPLWNPYGVLSPGGRAVALIYQEIGEVPLNQKATDSDNVKDSSKNQKDPEDPK